MTAGAVTQLHPITRAGCSHMQRLGCSLILVCAPPPQIWPSPDVVVAKLPKGKLIQKITKLPW